MFDKWTIKKKWLLFPVFFFLYLLAIFDLNIPIFGPASIFLVISVSMFFLNDHIRTFKSKYFFQLLIILYVACAFVVFRSVNTNIDYILIFFKVVIVIMTSFLLTLFIIKKYTIDYFLAVFFLVLTLQSISPWFFISFEPYREVVSSLQYYDPIRNFETRGVMAIRKSFISGSGGYFGMAIGLGLGLIISTWFFVLEKINKYKFFVFFILLSVAAILAGRTAIMFVFFALLVLFFNLNFIKKITLAMIFFIACFIFWFSIDFLYSISNEYKVLGWALEPVMNYYSDGTVESESTSILMDMFYLPDVKTFLLGDGLYYSKTGGYYGGVDVGYLRQVLFGGVLIVIFSVFYLFYALSNGSKWIVLSIAIPLMLAHFKGVVLLSTPTAMSLLSSFSAYLYYKKYNKG
ncbi:hypothetical protein [Vibrio metschnikovii]|uniref:hypothetical protein n=1 Tax=Vibrio metschnikovii TaxID=28172 RepID=UPI001C30F106|nr:hypothetical protein [Vibrio metschnikovii]